MTNKKISAELQEKSGSKTTRSFTIQKQKTGLRFGVHSTTVLGLLEKKVENGQILTEPVRSFWKRLDYSLPKTRIQYAGRTSEYCKIDLKGGR